MNMRSLRVSSTHALRGSLSRRSEVSSTGDCLGRVGATISLGVVCEGCLGFAGLFALFAGAYLWPTVTLGVDFAVLPFFLVVATSFRVVLGVTEMGGGLGEAGFVALMTRPPRTTWFQPCPKLSCSAVGSGRCAFGATGGAGCTTHLAAHDRRPLSKRRPGLLPFCTAPVDGCVVSSAAVALKLLLWVGALP